MTFDSQTYLPKPRNWFTENIKYEGYGRAEFADPSGWVEGYVHIEFDILGNSKIEMQVSSYHNDHNTDKEYALERLLLGQKPEGEINQLAYSLHGPKNKCISFAVQSEDFIFTAIGTVDFDPSFTPVTGKLPFACWQSFVDFRSSKNPKFWLMPLLNFVADFGIYYKGLNNHPLRLYDFPQIPEDLSDKERFVAYSNQQLANALVTFEYEGNQGFIEMLPDFKQKKEALKNLPYAITALMNCELGEKQSTDLKELRRWFPVQFLDLLSLAVGTRVSPPWIEFRDESGNILSRLHDPQSSRQYVDGHRVINESIHRGLGLLLTKAAISKHFRDEALSDIIEQLILSTSKSLAWADRIAHLARAIDTLCWEYNFYEKTKLKDYLSLEQKKEVEAAIESAISIITSVQSKLKSDGKDDAAKMLKLVSDKISQAKTIEASFSTAIYALLQAYNLPDAQIIDNYYSLFPLVDRKQKLKTWGHVLSHIRGKSIHHISYLNTSGITWDDLEQVARHLHDVIVRVLFKMLDYTGKYQPLVIRLPSDSYTPDWVKPDTTASRLGFKPK